MNYLLLRAERAIDYVTNTVRIKTGNRAEGINRRQNERHATNQRITASRNFARQQFAQHNLSTGLHEASMRAQVAEFSNVGNCTEQSAIAFEYLRKHGERRMAWIAFPEHNHMFTVLGLTVQPRNVAYFRIGSGAPLNWSPGAVVCDPWYHEWFEVGAGWDKKISQILTATSGRTVTPGTWCKIQCRAYIN